MALFLTRTDKFRHSTASFWARGVTRPRLGIPPWHKVPKDCPPPPRPCRDEDLLGLGDCADMCLSLAINRVRGDYYGDPCESACREACESMSQAPFALTCAGVAAGISAFWACMAGQAWEETQHSLCVRRCTAFGIPEAVCEFICSGQAPGG
jgi:hypothetical protein